MMVHDAFHLLTYEPTDRHNIQLRGQEVGVGQFLSTTFEVKSSF